LTATATVGASSALPPTTTAAAVRERCRVPTVSAIPSTLRSGARRVGADSAASHEVLSGCSDDLAKTLSHPLDYRTRLALRGPEVAGKGSKQWHRIPPRGRDASARHGLRYVVGEHGF